MSSQVSKQKNTGMLSRLLFVILILGSSGIPVTDLSGQELGTPSVEETRFTIVPIGEHPLGFFSDVPVATGESTVLEATVVNTGSVPVDLRIYATNAGNASSGGFDAGYLGDQLVGPSLWIDLEESVVRLEPTEEFVVSFTINVPKGAKPGQYISALVAETAAPLPLSGSDVLDQIVRFAISIGVLVPGKIVHGFDLGNPTFEEHRLKIPISNTGNYLVRPQGDLTVTDDSGKIIISQPIDLGSIYGGNEIEFTMYLPDQIPSGEYFLNLQLHDPDSGTSARLLEERFTIPEPEDPTGVYLREHSIEPNAKSIVFAEVSVAIDNGGQQLNSVDATLVVSRDEKVVDEFPLAVNQTLTNGENILTARYIPVDLWESGTYTFNIVVYSVDPNSGTQIELLNEELDAEIVVP